MAKTRIQLPKIDTGVVGLDDILDGGLPKGRTTLVNGGPGCGKSIMSMEMLYRRARIGDPAIFVTFEEQVEDVRQNYLTLGWDLAELESSGSLFIMNAYVDPESIISGEFDLQGLLAILGGKAQAMGAGLIAIDALDVFMNLINDPDRRRNEIYRLHNWLKKQKLTTIMTMKSFSGGLKVPSYEFLDFMVDCVLHLDHRIENQVSTRRLRIVKYRGSDFARNEYPFTITENGFYIVPISSSDLNHMPLGEKMPTGHSEFDRIIDGGYRRGSSILISGASGTGKTTLTCTFAIAACQRNEKTLIINFEESKDAAVNNMLSPGLDLRPELESGNLRFIGIMPESSGCEEHLIRIIETIDEFAPDHLIIDAISAVKRTGSAQSSSEFLKRLMNYTKNLGITLFYINQTEGFINTALTEISGINISSLLDTVIFLRYIESGRKINRLLLVMKARGSYHLNEYQEYCITDKGIEFKDNQEDWNFENRNSVKGKYNV